jgi:membrane associated rhomboid family serine protease
LLCFADAPISSTATLSTIDLLHMPLGSLVLLTVTCIASLAGLFAAPQLIRRSLFRPYWLVRQSEYLTLVTSGFMHADLGHLIFNAITFYSFGPLLERRIGTITFLELYFTGLLTGNIGTYVRHRSDPKYSCLGASGAILAVLFASIVYFPQQHLFILPLPVPIPAPLFAIGYLAYTSYSARQQQGNINHSAHLGGALAGLAFVALLDPGAYANVLALLN